MSVSAAGSLPRSAIDERSSLLAYAFEVDEMRWRCIGVVAVEGRPVTGIEEL